MILPGGRSSDHGCQNALSRILNLAASTLCAAAIELLNPHDVLNKTRRDMNAFDQRMKGYKAEQQKKEKEAEAKRKNEEAERQKRENAEKALEEAQSRKEEAEKNRSERRPRRLSKTPNGNAKPPNNGNERGRPRLSRRLRRSGMQQPQSPPKELRPHQSRPPRLHPQPAYRNRVRRVSPETHHSSAEASG